MTTRTKRAIIAALALFGATVLVGAIGLWRGLNVVNVHVETIRDEDGHYHRRWTFTGGRWESYGQGFKNGEHFVVLDPPGARAPAALRFLKETLGMGANRLVYEVEARRILPRGGNGPSFLSIKRTLSGNANGAPGFSETKASTMGDVPWDSQFRTSQANDTTITVPAKIKLGDFGGSAEVIEFR